MRFLQSIVRPLTAWAASTAVAPIDLPVNPLSLLLLRLQITNINPNALLLYSAIEDVVDNVTSIIVKHKGENIMQGSLRDLMVLNMLLGKRFPHWDRLTNASGGIRSITFPLGFSRREFDPIEAFPATSRGNLTLEMARGADPASLSALSFSIEAVELIEATPKQYIKATTMSQTAVVGSYDQSLPIGNPLLALLFFDTALATLNTLTSSWGAVKLLKDNIEQYYPLSDAQVLAGMMGVHLGQWAEGFPSHVHQYDDGAALEVADDAHHPVSTGMRGYFAMNFDPLGDGSYALETAGAADVKVRAVGTSATPVRVLPVELVPVKAG